MSTDIQSDFVIRRYGVKLESTSKPNHDPLGRTPAYSVPLVFEDVFDVTVSPVHLITNLGYTQVVRFSSGAHSNISRLMQDKIPTSHRVLLTACSVEQVFGRYLKIRVYGLAVSFEPIKKHVSAHKIHIYVQGEGAIRVGVYLRARELCRLGCEGVACVRHVPLDLPLRGGAAANEVTT